MKTKLISLTLLLIITATLILAGGCTNDNEPNFGATGAKVYEPALSEMSDQSIRDRINELYENGMSNGVKPWGLTANYAAMISVYQNELILRQLEGKVVKDDTGDKQSSKSLKGKLQAKGFKDRLKGLEKQGIGVKGR